MDGKPWAAAVFYCHDKDYNFYFLSSIDSQHAENIIKNSKVSIVIYNSESPVGDVRGLQIDGNAALVGEGEIHKVIAIYSEKLFPNSKVPPEKRYSPKDYLGAAEIRFFKVKVLSAYLSSFNRRESKVGLL